MCQNMWWLPRIVARECLNLVGHWRLEPHTTPGLKFLFLEFRFLNFKSEVIQTYQKESCNFKQSDDLLWLLGK